jgi:hypothetical protein
VDRRGDAREDRLAGDIGLGDTAIRPEPPPHLVRAFAADADRQGLNAMVAAPGEAVASAREGYLRPRRGAAPSLVDVGDIGSDHGVGLDGSTRWELVHPFQLDERGLGQGVAHEVPVEGAPA